MEINRPPSAEFPRDLRKLAGEQQPEQPQEEAQAAPALALPAADDKAPASAQSNKHHRRCSSCSKKVGLTGGLECKCGQLFCSKHRYPESHSCSFDFKNAERAQLAKTVVGGGQFDKVNKI